MRSLLTAAVVAAGLTAFGSAAQAAPVPAGPAGAAQNPLELVQLTPHERRMVHRRVERRMIRREVKRRMIRRQIRRQVRREMGR